MPDLFFMNALCELHGAFLFLRTSLAHTLGVVAANLFPREEFV